jgi:hypothetical protein
MAEKKGLKVEKGKGRQLDSRSRTKYHFCFTAWRVSTIPKRVFSANGSSLDVGEIFSNGILNLFQKKYFAPNLATTLALYVFECYTCAASKRSGLQDISRANRAMHAIIFKISSNIRIGKI